MEDESGKWKVESGKRKVKSEDLRVKISLSQLLTLQSSIYDSKDTPSVTFGDTSPKGGGKGAG